MKKLLFSLLIVFFAPFCFASGGPVLFTPQNADTLWYTWASYSGQSMQIFSSKWDGTKWDKTHQLTNNPSCCFTPAVALDKSMNPWVVWAGQDGVKTSIYSTYYDGNKWSKTIQVDDVDIYSDNNPCIIVANDNIPWIAWVGSNGKNDDIYVSNWDGKNWAYPVKINSENPVPHIMPVISIDKNNDLIIVWCSYETDRYKLFFSQRINGKWTTEKHVIEGTDRFSVDMPHILSNNDGTIELLWNERNIYYKSIWDGRKWSNPVEIDIPVLPEDFLQEQPVGSGYISWSENNLTRSIRILEPAPKKILTACNNNSSYSIFAWLTNNIDPVLYAAVEDNKYIAFGDSITYGMGGTEGYPSRLQRLLTERVAPSTVVNEGIPGERTPGGVVRFDDVLNNNAKYMLIMEGTNDITMNYSTESIIFNLGQMIDRSISFGTTPLIALLTPRKDGLNGRVADDVNPAISQLATDKGILLVDQYSEMNASKDTYMFDHVHPNDAGYGLMAEIWCRAIKDMLSPPKEEKKTGCGAIPPIAQKNGSGGLYHNLSFLVFVFIFLVYYRFKFSK